MPDAPGYPVAYGTAPSLSIQTQWRFDEHDKLSAAAVDEVAVGSPSTRSGTASRATAFTRTPDEVYFRPRHPRLELHVTVVPYSPPIGGL
jgi:hypothetical protein